MDVLHWVGVVGLGLAAITFGTLLLVGMVSVLFGTKNLLDALTHIADDVHLRSLIYKAAQAVYSITAPDDRASGPGVVARHFGIELFDEAGDWTSLGLLVMDAWSTVLRERGGTNG